MSQQTYFKNPYRGRKTAKPSAYQPEHKRLEVSTIDYPIKDPEEFEKMNKKSATERKRSEKKKKIDEQAKVAIEKFRNGEWTKEELEEALKELYNEVPKQEIAAKTKTPLVSSGQNEELQWTKALAGGSIVVEEQVDDDPIDDDDIPLPPESPFVEEEENDPKTGRVIKPLTEEEIAEAAADIIYNVREEAEGINEEGGDGFGLDQVRLGEYVLLYKNSVLGMGSLESVKNTLTSIMDGDDKLSVEDFVVMKRVPVKMGIFIDD